MIVTYEYDKERNEIYSKHPKILTNEILEAYFLELISKKNQINGAKEFADFTGVEEFRNDLDKTYILADLYKTIADEKIVTKTVFKVKNAYQYGMSRMFSTLAHESNNEFDFEFIDWHPNK